MLIFRKFNIFENYRKFVSFCVFMVTKLRQIQNDTNFRINIDVSYDTRKYPENYYG